LLISINNKKKKKKKSTHLKKQFLSKLLNLAIQIKSVPFFITEDKNFAYQTSK